MIGKFIVPCVELPFEILDDDGTVLFHEHGMTEYFRPDQANQG